MRQDRPTIKTSMLAGRSIGTEMLAGPGLRRHSLFPGGIQSSPAGREIVPGLTREQSLVLEAWKDGLTTYEDIQTHTGLTTRQVDKALKFLDKKELLGSPQTQAQTSRVNVLGRSSGNNSLGGANMLPTYRGGPS